MSVRKKVFLIQKSLGIRYINLRKSLEIQTSLIFSIFFTVAKNSGHNLDIMRHTACIGLNPNMNDSCAALFSCTAVVQASDSLTASMFKTFKYLVEA